MKRQEILSPSHIPWDEAEISRKAPLIAQRFVREKSLPASEYDDLAQVARIAVWRATRTFQPARGFAFATYATATAWQAMLNHRRDTAWIGTRFWYRYGYGRDPRPTERLPVSLDALPRGYRDRYVNWVPDPTPGPEAQVSERDAGAWLWRVALEALDARLYLLLHLRYREGLTLDEIGVRVGMHGMSVNRALRRAEKALRERLATAGEAEAGRKGREG